MQSNRPNVFLGLPEQFSDRRRAKYVIVPVPYDATVCFLTGTARGPEAILNVSPQMEWLDEETRREIHLSGIATDDPIEPARSPEEQMQRVRERIDSWIAQGRFPIMLGGEHSITFGAVDAMIDHHGPISVLQFDAHADLRNEYTGGRFSHASVMRRILERTDSIVQVGIRSFSPEEARECAPRIDRLIPPQVVRHDLKAAIGDIVQRLDQKVYITIDMDAFDPAVAPGVGTPEPGGLDYREVLAILRAVIQAKTVVGADVVETLPLGGNHIRTEFLAARLVGKLIAYLEESNETT